ncbi:hypothetical protein ACFC1R_35560 [Kitasatospora sp. NPDC056138]|uniref:hypothetical protein n=1 Tax=Kitasatospora sp. NPDC056138 TaxID=3345724 RepID=UPI0035DF2885
MTAPTPPPGRTDAQLAAYDVPTLLRFGLPQDGPYRLALFSNGAVAAAIHADGLAVQPRGIRLLAEIVRAGGIRNAAGLPEPLPGQAATTLARSWLDAALEAVGSTGVDGDTLAARWLDAVATVVGLRIDNRQEQTGRQA